MPALITDNKLVSVAYTIRDVNGTIVEHSDLPISYVHGVNSSPLFPKVETALEGLAMGDRIEVFLTADQAFGEHDPSLIYTEEIDNTPEELHFVGAELDAENDQGDVLHFRVTRIDDGQITVDANHPLAGQDITFSARVADIRDATGEEISRQAKQFVH
ncbi:MAG: peptidylprolyl isomerase [Proteobacteria bacterium]|jgi:FKBP-type peptidyl-prolyl cis-trans isomerase SlyD|uniref:peptidylprolyl isomerase n=1 Tax=marine metagenome TaxID=408172 RepID=A0A381Y0G2_9ZZZZ|nr:peptidylprolyl isomerase [Pseudomonadota bacterium]MDP6137201.1 hypothetical protein [Arenicellales bacterium]MDP6392957.1 hypothetical protein [Arenicellales bacterium]MDP7219219.1 hypothetical protein [Arenicellales bacterium]HJP10232.1 hypothetical protein [Arenicellales bacterium]|tara:strand:- start:53098 stop:53574 length:477 start_codon:yes stop_codon:yes gene_type:complete